MPASHPDFMASVEDLVLFAALEQGWLSKNMRLVPCVVECDHVQVPIVPRDGSQTPIEMDSVEFTGVVVQVNRYGGQRIIRIGFSERSETCIYHVSPWGWLRRPGKLHTNA